MIKRYDLVVDSYGDATVVESPKGTVVFYEDLETLRNEAVAEGINKVREFYLTERHLVAEEDLAQFDFAMSHLELMALKARGGNLK